MTAAAQVAPQSFALPAFEGRKQVLLVELLEELLVLDGFEAVDELTALGPHAAEASAIRAACSFSRRSAMR